MPSNYQPDRVGEHKTFHSSGRYEHAKIALPLKNSGTARTYTEEPARARCTVRPLPINISLLFILVGIHLHLQLRSQAHHQAAAQLEGVAFPGVSRDLASFCSARPSLSIDLAPMLVHVKKNTSFNYKLYLFSNDEHVFQTGQIVPRDDFRIHSFPVKLKHLNEFVPISERSGEHQHDEQRPHVPVEVYQLATLGDNRGHKRPSLVRVSSSSFDPKRFFSRVPLVPEGQPNKDTKVKQPRAAGSTPRPKPKPKPNERASTSSRPAQSRVPFDVQGDVLPGDESFAHHDAASLPDIGPTQSAPYANVNEHIEFDRDDQLAVLNGPASKLRELSRRHPAPPDTSGDQSQAQTLGPHSHHQAMVMPVGSFSSFRVNITYLARKEFGQLEPELVRFRVDPQRFQVSRVDILWPQQADGGQSAAATNSLAHEDDDHPQADDYAFLSHKLLRDPHVRLTSITQIYEDWITRNFYTIVYIQRRLNAPEDGQGDVALMADEAESTSMEDNERRRPPAQRPIDRGSFELVTDRLVFRGSSIVLLGADQLNYHVKASAFITEKNGLHYYLEFLPTGKFYLGAIDWSKRPFKFIDSQRFPIKPTRTQFDNEELLLCPPSVCYSEQPIDELVTYGRLALSEKLQREAMILSKSSSSSVGLMEPWKEGRVLTLLPEHRRPAVESAELLLAAHSLANNNTGQHLAGVSTPSAAIQPSGSTSSVSYQGESTSFDNLIESMKAGSSRLNVRLHLRDWAWQLPRVHETASTTNNTFSSTKFAWHYEWARRNEIKVAPDTYGFALVGHEIDASYRVFNELYLISANQLISINYTLANETVTSMHPIEDEFAGLSSSLLDPITGAFYDRYSNQIYFFKGDRYVGYDYATKKPLEDFVLPPAIDDSLGGMGLALMMKQTAAATSQQPAEEAKRQGALVSSLPVVNILGRQHYVDAIYHDLHEDVVYVFAGMKFYTHQARNFKDGAFRVASAQRSAPQLHCINEHFLAGCRFDAAYPNPCKSEERLGGGLDDAAGGHAHDLVDKSDVRKHGANLVQATLDASRGKSANGDKFSDEQQMKLRSIAARGGGGGLMDYLLENTLVAQGAARAFEPLLVQGNSARPVGSGTRSSEQEQIVIYLLIAMVLVTVLVTVAMIIVVLNWAQVKPAADGQRHDHQTPMGGKSVEDQRGTSLGGAGVPPLSQGQLLTERVAYPQAISHYLSNQYQQQSHRQRPSTSYYYGGLQTSNGRRLSSHVPPMTSPPSLPPPPKPRRPYRVGVLGDSEATSAKGQQDHQSSLVDSSIF